jgi:uncharacterized protein
VPSATLALLLPPSEGKASGGNGPGWNPADGAFGPLLRERRQAVMAALAAVDGGHQKLLGVGGVHLERARNANRHLVGAPTMAANQRYTGVVWDHLDAATLSGAAKRRAARNVAVVSGLHGVVLAGDPVPEYRLKMGATLAPLGVMSRWWRPGVTEAIEQWARGRVVVDLLPQEHRAAWDPDPATFAAVIRVNLVEFDDTSGTSRVVGHHAKAAKGLLARHLIECGGDPRRALSSWQHPRFSLHLDPTPL